MESAAWQRVFNSIRIEDQDGLIINLNSGFEINVSIFASVEEDVVVVRGRASGSEEGGRVFILPYQSIATIYVNRVVPEMETELFFPSATPERKAQVAEELARMQELQRQQEKSEKNAGSSKVDPEEIKRQLDELRAAAGLGAREAPPPPEPAPVPGKNPTGPDKGQIGHTPLQIPQNDPKPATPPGKLGIPSGPPRFNLPQPPKK